MRRYSIPVLIAGCILVAAALVVAHPHFNKTITVTLAGNITATITYQTVPSNEAWAEKAAVGDFTTPRQPKLKLSADAKGGAVAIPAGEYIIGVIKNSESDWTMALYSGPLKRGEKPEASKLIKLESMFVTSGVAPHLLVDISPGNGKMEGRAVVTMHFGKLFLAGAIS